MYLKVQVLYEGHVQVGPFRQSSVALAKQLEQLFPLLEGVVVLAHQEADEAELQLGQSLVSAALVRAHGPARHRVAVQPLERLQVVFKLLKNQALVLVGIIIRFKRAKLTAFLLWLFYLKSCVHRVLCDFCRSGALWVTPGGYGCVTDLRTWHTFHRRKLQTRQTQHSGHTLVIHLLHLNGKKDILSSLLVDFLVKI